MTRLYVVRKRGHEWCDSFLRTEVVSYNNLRIYCCIEVEDTESFARCTLPPVCSSASSLSIALGDIMYGMERRRAMALSPATLFAPTIYEIRLMPYLIGTLGACHEL